MVNKLIDATEAKVGTSIILDGAACTVKKMDISKTGKHGHAKARIEAVGVLDGKKRVLVVPGHDRFEVPTINKNKAQILSISGDMASVMDLENFETLELPIPEDVRAEVELKPEDTVEYWDVEGNKVIKRKL